MKIVHPNSNGAAHIDRSRTTFLQGPYHAYGLVRPLTIFYSTSISIMSVHCLQKCTLNMD